jgi:catechol 2,3-dioxygenase-like lactoylglutathione lyase family enzyme
VPSLNGVLETAVYVDDMSRARRFYEEVLDLQPMVADERLCAYSVGGRSVFLLFLRGSSLSPVPMGGGHIPPHDGQGRLHMAFSVDSAELAGWERRLDERGIAVESRVTWPRGGRSLYFRDPDDNLLELVTPGVWPSY